jgi:thioredoxin 1
MGRGDNKMADLKLQQFSRESLDAEVTEATTPILIDFWAPWCGTCRLMAPVIAQLAETHREALVVGAVNVELYPEVSEDYEVQGLPTLVLVKDGKEALRITQFRGREALAEALAPYLEVTHDQASNGH